MSALSHFSDVPTEQTMRVQYRVREANGMWCVERGFTAPLRFQTRDGALAAAENLARATAANGERALLRLISPDGGEEIRSFLPDAIPNHPRVRFEPEHDVDAKRPDRPGWL